MALDIFVRFYVYLRYLSIWGPVPLLAKPLKRRYSLQSISLSVYRLLKVHVDDDDDDDDGELYHRGQERGVIHITACSLSIARLNSWSPI